MLVRFPCCSILFSSSNLWLSILKRMKTNSLINREIPLRRHYALIDFYTKIEFKLEYQRRKKISCHRSNFEEGLKEKEKEKNMSHFLLFHPFKIVNEALCMQMSSKHVTAANFLWKLKCGNVGSTQHTTDVFTILWNDTTWRLA